MAAAVMRSSCSFSTNLIFHHNTRISYLLANKCSQLNLKRQQSGGVLERGDEGEEKLPNILSSGLPSEERVFRISKAMRAYLERAKEHEALMKKHREEFEIGKRHLANMMGLDPEMIAQADIDRAIEYLMPSGLYEKKARPMMKPPEEVFPRQKEAEFDYSGRPFHFLFYTTKPNYYNVLHDTVNHLKELNKFEDRMIQKGVKVPSAETKMVLGDSEWLSKEELEKLLVEKLKDKHYEYIITTLNNLSEHPYSARVKEFVMKFRKPRTVALKKKEIPPLMYDEKGCQYAEGTGNRKSSKATVIVKGNGSGKIRINGEDISFFERIQDREQIMYPLQFTGLLMKVDVEANASEGGPTGMAGAIRLAISHALCSFVSKEMIEKMRLAGLLTWDPRVRERKKPGQEGARRKYTWLKR